MTTRGSEEIQPGAAGERELQSAGPSLGGFRNLVDKENREWLAGWAWLAHAAIWLVLVAGVPLVVAFIRAQGGNGAQDVNEIGSLMYFVMGSVASVIAVVAKTQGAIIGEKQSGTAAWVLSKPTSRRAFVLAKLAVHLRWLLVLTLGVPAVVFYALMPTISGLPIAVLPFLGGFGVLALGLTFYLALSLLLGTVFASRGPVAAIVFGFFTGGFMLTQYAEWLTAAFPWLFFETAYYLVAEGREVPAIGVSAIVATALWSILLVAAALWSFKRSEV